MISFIGEILHNLIPLPIPAGIYGMIILFLALEFKILKLEKVKIAGDFLVKIMPVMFIPAAVALLGYIEAVAEFWIAYLLICIVTTIIVMVVSGKTTDKFIKDK